jgi:hypothetical protein
VLHALGKNLGIRQGHAQRTVRDGGKDAENGESDEHLDERKPA